jgi:hypothetical protein
LAAPSSETTTRATKLRASQAYRAGRRRHCTRPVRH